MAERALVLVVAVPALALAAASLLRSVPGEWSQSALLAWAAVSLAYLGGQAAVPLGVAVAALALAFAALALGGATGLLVLVATGLTLAAAALAGVVTAPWPAAALLAPACAIGAARPLIH